MRNSYGFKMLCMPLTWEIQKSVGIVSEPSGPSGARPAREQPFLSTRTLVFRVRNFNMLIFSGMQWNDE